MAALGAHRRLLFDLVGDHLEDARGPPPQRSALLQLDAARHRPAATTTRRPAGARCAKTRLLSRGHDRDQAAARLDGGAQGVAPDRAWQTRELLFEGGVAALDCVPRMQRSAKRCVAEPGSTAAMGPGHESLTSTASEARAA